MIVGCILVQGRCWCCNFPEVVYECGTCSTGVPVVTGGNKVNVFVVYIKWTEQANVAD